MNLFPFSLSRNDSIDLWVAARPTVAPGMSWYEVEVQALDATSVKFRVYDLDCRLTDTIDAQVKPEALARAIAARKLAIAGQVHDQRERWSARLARARAVDAVHLELFGDLPEDPT